MEKIVHTVSDEVVLVSPSPEKPHKHYEFEKVYSDKGITCCVHFSCSALGSGVCLCQNRCQILKKTCQLKHLYLTDVLSAVVGKLLHKSNEITSLKITLKKG